MASLASFVSFVSLASFVFGSFSFVSFAGRALLSAEGSGPAVLITVLSAFCRAQWEMALERTGFHVSTTWVVRFRVSRFAIANFVNSVEGSRRRVSSPINRLCW